MVRKIKKVKLIAHFTVKRLHVIEMIWMWSHLREMLPSNIVQENDQTCIDWESSIL